MKWCAALIESSEFDWSEAKLSCYARNSCAGIGVIARYEHDLLLPGRLCSKLDDRQMIEGLDEAGSGKRFRYNFRRKQISQLSRSSMKGVRDVDHDLVIPLLEALRNILVSRKWNGEEDHVSLISVFNGLGNDPRTEFVGQRRKRLRSTGVCDRDFDILTCEDACERGANLAATNDGVVHREPPVSAVAEQFVRGDRSGSSGSNRGSPEKSRMSDRATPDRDDRRVTERELSIYMDRMVNNKRSIWTAWSKSAKMLCMGRPASFDQAEMLETIQSVFWDNGYSATSLDDLMKSTGLGKGSLYGAYGSKQDMYLSAFTDYCDWAIKDAEERLRGSDEGAIMRLRKYIQTAAKGAAGSRRGCMLAKGTAEVAGRFPEVDKVIETTFKAMEGEIVKCVRQAERAGDIDRDRDARTIAVTLLAVVRGMEALGEAGASSASLSLVAQGALGLLKPTSR
jgi:TetR/AcrR family transcriptional repressor of nem operon